MFLKIAVEDERRKEIIKKCISVTYQLLCLIGLIVQCVSVTMTYFEYKTTTKINIDLRYEIEMPDYTICMSFTSLLDAVWVKQNKKLDLKREGNNVSRIVTIQEILDHTPDSRFLLDSCITRYPYSYKVQDHKGFQCLDQFDISKSVFGEFVCYTLSLKRRDSQMKYNTKKIIYSRRLSRIMYVFNLNHSTFDSVTVMKPMIHNTGTLPYITSSFSMTSTLR